MSGRVQAMESVVLVNVVHRRHFQNLNIRVHVGQLREEQTEKNCQQCSDHRVVDVADFVHDGEPTVIVFVVGSVRNFVHCHVHNAIAVRGRRVKERLLDVFDY